MTRRQHIAAIICYGILSVAILMFGLFIWSTWDDGSFLDFMMALVGALWVQIHGAGRHVRALDSTK
jgi:hypothetical protein